MKTRVGSPIKVSSVSSLSEMSTVQGLVGEKPVEVLRDAGCSGVIVSKDLVPALAVQTRAYTKREGVTSKLKIPSIINRTITPALASNSQKDVVSLMTTRS